MFSKDVTIEGEILAKDWKVNMSKDVKLNTLLAQAGVKKDETTGALTTPLHFSTTYSTLSLASQQVMTILGPRIQRGLAWKRLWLLSKVQIML